MGKKKIVVLTGAGVSAESGISTFRDNGGLWDKYDVNDVASIDGWYRNRKLVLDFYNLRRAELEKARPNAAHLAIAALENRYEVTVVTQNVDNLHERAGSTKIIHLHGELTKVRPETGVYDSSFSEAEIIDVGYSAVHLGDTAPNGSQLRPHIVFFGESVPKIDAAISVVERADILLIVGGTVPVRPVGMSDLYHRPERSARGGSPHHADPGGGFPRNGNFPRIFGRKIIFFLPLQPL